MSHLDVMALDRELSRTAHAWERWRAGLRQGRGLDEDPFEPLAVFAPPVGKTAFDAVAELTTGDPMRRPLQRWMYRLAEQRINRAALAGTAWLRHGATHPLHEPRRGQYSIRQIVRQILTDPSRRGEWVRALVETGRDLGAAEGLLWERRREVAQRMGLASPNDIESPSPTVPAVAERWLEGTESLAKEVWPPDLGAFITAALGTEAVEGWPARLTPRTVAELLRETGWLRRVSFDVPELPSPIAPASYVRALDQVGWAWARALTPHHQPFVIARDPYDLSTRALATRFALLTLNRPFLVRSLGLGADRARAHARTLARVVLLSVRIAALRVTLRRHALNGTQALQEAFPDAVRSALGFALPPHLAAVVFRLEVDDLAQFAGILRGAAAVVEDVEEHDEDWFRNPRAQEAFRAAADRSPDTESSEPELEAGMNALLRILTEAWE